MDKHHSKFLPSKTLALFFNTNVHMDALCLSYSCFFSTISFSHLARPSFERMFRIKMRKNGSMSPKTR
eukprot:m.6343 g.6343  ORF g.6343 m.6343 type:complete len:68 (-) comp2581_c0_seq1:1238-1441(-)